MDERNIPSSPVSCNTLEQTSADIDAYSVTTLKLKCDLGCISQIKNQLNGKIKVVSDEQNAEASTKVAYKQNYDRACDLAEQCDMFLGAMEYDRILSKRELSLNKQILDLRERSESCVTNAAQHEAANLRLQREILIVSDELEKNTFLGQITNCKSGGQSNAEIQSPDREMIWEMKDAEGIKDPRIVCVKNLVETMLQKQQSSLAKLVCQNSLSDYKIDTLEYAAVRGILGVVCTSDEQNGEALEHYNYAMSVYDRLANKAGAATIAGRLSTFYFKAKLYDKAIEYNDKAISIRRKIHGEKHELVAREMNANSILMFRKGEIEKAVAQSRECLEIYKSLYENDHPSILKLKTNQARFCTKGGYFSDAERLLTDIVPVYQRLLLGLETLETSILDVVKSMEDTDTTMAKVTAPSYNFNFNAVDNSANAFKALADLYHRTQRKEAHGLIVSCLSSGTSMTPRFSIN